MRHNDICILKNIFTGLTYISLLSCMSISDVYRSFILDKSTFTKYCLTHWISKLPGSFEIHLVMQYLQNFWGLVGIVNATVFKTCQTICDARESLAWQIILILINTEYVSILSQPRFCLDLLCSHACLTTQRAGHFTNIQQSNWVHT